MQKIECIVTCGFDYVRKPTSTLDDVRYRYDTYGIQTGHKVLGIAIVRDMLKN